MSMNLTNYPRSGDVLVDGQTVGSALASGTPTPVELYSAEWWRDRLLRGLASRAAICQADHDFYEGRQPLAFASDKFISTYGGRFGKFPANFMPLVVDAERERLVVAGFRFGSNPDSDKGVWRIWQDNQMDAESQIAHEIALSKGMAYAAVDPGSDSASITIEDPTEVIVETSPGNRRNRLAALKVFTDDDGYSRAVLFMPDDIFRWRSQQRRTDATYTSMLQLRWEPDLAAGDFPVVNRLGVVPIVPLINRPRRNGTGRSEIEPVKGNQLAINFLRYAALIGSDTAALPQRWAKNLDIEIDDSTGQPKVPFRTGRDVLWATRRPTPDEVAEYDSGQFPDVDFGQFPAASLQPFVDMIREEVGQMASNSRTPYHYLLGTPTSVPPSGESLKSSEAPLVKKVEAQEIHFGEGWEETMRVALLAVGQTSKAKRTTDAETIWRDAETRNEAARTDSILKQYQAGLLPDDFALEQLGYSPQQIERIGTMRAQADAVAPAPSITTIGTDAAGNQVITRSA